ncbi:endopeptidase [Cryptococcus wingfieldii CBS 7118]|uniref:Endopeptidase n=1 Tax=Cryptococcus wingfieldii CBS 7118 TaxID=1295528 RepID=A0A1E3J0B1_9TREE|nr:endopeptidase [Cryptococcus wingfieldii CBS 7118]ODN94323.1 endopeptidase [Cryptococcus wingfieldii CBS 7118]
MLASILLLALPLALANPVPTSSPAASPSSTSGGFSARLSHGQGAIARSNSYANAKRGLVARVDDEGLPPSWLLWAGARLDAKYDGANGFKEAYAKEITKRADNGEISLTDHNLDTSYSASLSVGTPAQTLDIVLDTGSSDLWLASDKCSTTACSSMDEYSLSNSSTAVNLSTSFSIEYGSGKASGALVQDLVTLGGYSVASQTFAACDSVSTGLLSTGVSGIMGLSWQALAYSKATPWWITLAKSSTWSQPLFAFYLARYRNVAGATAKETDGGTATFGYLDSSLYTGDVTYVDVDDDAQYWQIEMASATIQGSSISLNSSYNMVAIDTGTTLIGGPQSIVAEIYSKIDGARRMTGSYASYYEYPCNTSVELDLTFGGYTVEITDQDFNLGRYSSDTSMCTGAVYVQSLSSSSPVQWIVGDAAIKNTYTVFRYNPAAVGFAALAGSVTSSEAAQSTTIADISSVLAAASNSATASSSATASTTSASSSSAATSSTATSSEAASATSKAASVSSEAPHVVSVGSSSTETIGSATASESDSAAAASATSGALPLFSSSRWVVALLSAAVGVLLL